MTELVDLLDPAAQRTLREALEGRPDVARYGDILEPETLAAMAVVGDHPEELRDLAAAIMPIAARTQVDAYGLLDRHDTGERVVWRLTDTGHQLATALAAAAPAPDADEERRAAERLREIIEEGNADLEG